jgi:hypothetical protein
MLAQFGWRHLLAASVIATVITTIALSMSALPSLFDLAPAGPASHRLTNPRHDPAASHPPSNALDPFYDQPEMGGRHSGQH